MLLDVVALAGDVRCNNGAIGQLDTGRLALTRVGLLGLDDTNTQTDALERGTPVVGEGRGDGVARALALSAALEDLVYRRGAGCRCGKGARSKRGKDGRWRGRRRRRRQARAHERGGGGCCCCEGATSRGGEEVANDGADHFCCWFGRLGGPIGVDGVKCRWRSNPHSLVVVVFLSWLEKSFGKNGAPSFRQLGHRRGAGAGQDMASRGALALTVYSGFSASHMPILSGCRPPVLVLNSPAKAVLLQWFWLSRPPP